jgi:CheY-like chemotaxis protein
MATHTRDLEGRRIFIVEDDAVNLAVYAVLLKQSGAHVIQDPWNAGTVDLLLRTLPVDVILMDLMLRHGTSGYDIFDKLKAQPELAHIPVVAVSASDAAIEIPRARAKGFAGFIGKPIHLSTFPAQVAACIAGTQVWAPA